MRLLGDIMTEECVVSRTCVDLSRSADVVCHAQQVSKRLRESLEKMVACGGYGPNARVEVYTDGPYAMLFWYLVLYRPWNSGVVPQGFFKCSPTCIADALKSREDAAQLRMTNLGVMYDQERNWLVLSIPRAQQSGVLSGWDRCPAWVNLVKRLNNQKPTKDMTLDHAEYQWSMSRYSSFSIAKETLQSIGYMKKLGAFQGTGEPNFRYEDLAVLDCAALPLLEAEVRSNRWVLQDDLGANLRSELPPTLDLYIVRYTPADPVEAQKLRRATAALRRRELRERDRAKREAEGKPSVPAKERYCITPDKIDWHQRASAIIQQMFKAYSLKRGVIGRTRKTLSGNEVRMVYEELLGAFQRAEVMRGRSNAGKTNTQVAVLLRGLKECLANDETLPKEYRMWLVLENMPLSEAMQQYSP